MEQDKFPPLNLKLYLFSSTDAEQRQDQRQLPAEEKKDGSSPGPPTYSSVITTKINPYGGKTNPSKFCNRLDQANNFFKRKLNEEGEENTLSQTIRPGVGNNNTNWNEVSATQTGKHK